MPELYADENFPFPVVEELRRLGFAVLTMYEDGKANQSLSDEEVLSLAKDRKRAILTANRRHFIQLHRQQAKHAGIIVCTFDPDFDGQAQRIADALVKESDLAGQLIRIYRLA
jgi:predicted nuclease of predicted toxin-antitoxin system